MPIRQFITPPLSVGIIVCIASRGKFTDSRAGFDLTAGLGEVRSD